MTGIKKPLALIARFCAGIVFFLVANLVLHTASFGNSTPLCAPVIKEFTFHSEHEDRLVDQYTVRFEKLNGRGNCVHYKKFTKLDEYSLTLIFNGKSWNLDNSCLSGMEIDFDAIYGGPLREVGMMMVVFGSDHASKEIKDAAIYWDDDKTFCINSCQGDQCFPLH